MKTPPNEIAVKLRAAGQDHVLRWWGELDEPQRAALLSQIHRIDLEWVADTARRLRQGALASPFPQGLQPIDQCGASVPACENPNRGASAPACENPIRGASVPACEAASPGALAWTSAEGGARPLRVSAAAARAEGEALLRQGKVAAIVVAGGQGTRLGSSAPKGCFPVGPVSGRTLYQFHAEAVLAASRRWGMPVVFCVMTSDATDTPTRQFFQEHRWFGLHPEDVLFFRQGMNPALTPDGKLVLVEKGRILNSPDGHGGLYAALDEEGALDELERRGVEEISYFQVDNPLVRQVDPVFLGLHRLARAEMSCKALRKRDPAEGLGVFGLDGGKLRIVEYSDLPQEIKELTRHDGALAFGLGSPAIHAFNVEFLRRVIERAGDLPLHVAAKSSPVVDEAGRLVQPDGENVRKFEKFVFDALPWAERWTVMETRREDEFAPVKNCEGEDSPDTARRALVERWARWLEAAGCPAPRDAQGRAADIEISPLLAMDEGQLKEKLPFGFRAEEGMLLGDG